MTVATFSMLPSIVPRLAVATVAPPAAAPRSESLAELIDAYMAAYSGRDTAMAFRLQVWRKRLGDRPFQTLTTSEIREALRAIAAEPARAWRGMDADGKPIHRVVRTRRSAATVNRFLAALSGVLQWAIAEQRAPDEWRNPARGIKRGKESAGVVRFLDDQERRRLLDACRTSAWSKLYGLVLLALTSGARRGELLALRWRDVDLDRSIALLRRTKNGDEGSLVLTPAVVGELGSYKRGRPDDLVFCSPRNPTRPYAFEGLWKRALKAAGVERFRWHDLRHSFASALAQDGASLVEIADAMRHRSLVMVKRYAHLSAKSRAALVNRVLGDIR